MYLIRPIVSDELEVLFKMAQDSGVGVTTLPANHDRMAAKINRSVKSFADQVEQKDALYLFVLEDSESHEIVGICAIESQIGHQDVWYNYRLGNTVHASQELGVHKQIATLFLSNDQTGMTELCTLYLKPQYRKGMNGRFLSKSRYLFLAEFSERFSEYVIAEMRGYSDAQGHSPFWESLGKHFFSMEFRKADYLTGLGNKAFIAELMPKYPIYVPFLSADAQAVIGRVHENTEPALALLEQEGFRKNNYLDIFDAGPSVQCRLRDIRAVRASRLFRVKVRKDVAAIKEPKLDTAMVCNRQFANWRVVTCSRFNFTNDQVTLTPEQAEILGVGEGDVVRAVGMSPEHKF